MPSRQARARMQRDDPRIRIRNRYMEAIRGGATIAEATAYANGEAVIFTRSAPVTETPAVVKTRMQPTPGDGAQLLPAKVVGERPAMPATDPETESVKRPMAAPAATPVTGPPAKAVSASVETNTSAETPKPTVTNMRPPLPKGWDTADFPWPKLRGLCMALGIGTPNSRTDAVAAIKERLDTDIESQPA